MRSAREVPEFQSPMPNPSSQARWAPAELALVATALLSVIALQLVVARPDHLLTRPPWLDECMTSMLVNDPSFRHVIAAVRGGVENNPPAFYACFCGLQVCVVGSQDVAKALKAFTETEDVPVLATLEAARAVAA